MKRTHIILSLLLLFALLLTACATVVADPSTDPTETQASTKATQTDPTSTTNSTESSDYTDVTDPSESAVQTETTNPSETVDPDEEFREYILSRTPIPEEEYSYTIVCTPVLDPVGFAYQKLPASYVIDSIESLTPLTPELYNGFYTDDQCPISYDSLCTHYDEEFFRNHILMVVVVEAQNRMLPQIARIDLGIPTVKTAQIIAYVDNTVESPEDPQMYRIFIELPRSYVNFDEDPFYALTDAVDRSYSNNYWVWETAE